MAGKSTFLRTISLSVVMANIGLPVCANSFKYKPVKLITSMRTSDSLAENESYFYSELKRLKLIVDTVKTDDYFIVLDEILKGTNSKDKASGSKKFVEKLVTLNTTGIIATHDVSLCELENDFKEIKNFFFDAKISNNELSFDYLFKKGVCENMNASFLLKKMKII
jgi:DNA mismatch repair ATPase MutS